MHYNWLCLYLWFIQNYRCIITHYKYVHNALFMHPLCKLLLMIPFAFIMTFFTNESQFHIFDPCIYCKHTAGLFEQESFVKCDLWSMWTALTNCFCETGPRLASQCSSSFLSWFKQSRDLNPIHVSFPPNYTMLCSASHCAQRPLKQINSVIIFYRKKKKSAYSLRIRVF